MSTQSAHAQLAQAWARVPTSRAAVGDISRFTRRRVDRIIELISGLACAVFGAQALLAGLGANVAHDPMQLALLLFVSVPLVVMVLACVIGRGVLFAAGLFALIYPTALVLLPFTAAGLGDEGAGQPWIWFLVNVATIAAALAFPMPVAIVWTVTTPLLYGVVRLIQDTQDPDPGVYVGNSLDVSFALFLGAILLVLVWMFRSVASGVDDARAAAVASYAEAAATGAAEEERVAIAALMHDSVLAALLAAERAEGDREQALAASMAREALTRLANAEGVDQEGSAEPVDVSGIAEGIMAAGREWGLVLQIAAPEGIEVPGHVARALVLAATQAIANSVQHAGAEGLGVAVSTTKGGGVTVLVRDRGPGVDIAAVPEDRLGIRASIFARMTAVGGAAELVPISVGTAIRLTWEPRS